MVNTLIKNTRYYKIDLSSTLVNEYLVERVYGNSTYKAPTGKRSNYFGSLLEAKEFIFRLIKSKTKKGYIEIK